MNEFRERNREINSDILQKDRIKFFSDFAVSMKDDFKLLKIGGVLGMDAKKEGWRNVSEHCLVEALEADILAEKMGLDPKKLKTAALIHDWYKRREIEAVNKLGPEAHNTSIVEDEKLLKELGYSDEIISISKSVGHSSLAHMQEESVTLEEMVMHYIDDITAGSEIVRLEDRMSKNEANPKLQKLDQLEPFFIKQRQVGKVIEEKIAEKIGLSDPSEVPSLIKQEIEKRIIKHSQS